MLKILSFFLMLLLFVGQSKVSLAQHECGYDRLIAQDTTFRNHLIERTKDFSAKIKRNNLRRGFVYNYDTTYEIKVVFHVVYNNSLENIPDSCLLTQLEVLSEDFGRFNPDTGNTRAIFKDVAGKLNIKFVLADKDPDGNPHSGIIRKTTNITSFSEHGQGSTNLDKRMKYDAQGGSDAWNSDVYLNIWVCDMYPPSGGSFTAGYATPPTDAANWSLVFPKREQGIVVHYYTVGRYNPTATANGANGLGRTTTHEAGHYFGLFHTWGTRNACDDQFGDYMDDTPLSFSSNSGCNLNRNTCNSNDPGDLPDMVENYMDYTFGSCQNTFTKQQIALMKFNMKELRPSIYSPIVNKDSTEVDDATLEIKPFLFSNPGSKLILGADKYSQSVFLVNIFDMTGKIVLKDRIVVIDNFKTIDEAERLQYGNYIIKIKNKNTGKEFTYKWANVAL